MLTKQAVRKHNTVLRLRNDIADALDRVQWEDGVSKSSVIAVAVTELLVRRELEIRAGKRKRLLSRPSDRQGSRPQSTLVDEIAGASDLLTNGSSDTAMASGKVEG